MYKFILELKGTKVNVERRVCNGLRQMGERVYTSSDYKVGIYGSVLETVTKVSIYTESPDYVEQSVQMLGRFLQSDLNKLNDQSIKNIEYILDYIKEKL